MRDLCQGGSKSSKGGMTITTGTVIPTPQEASSSVISSGWDWAVSGKFMRLQSWQPRICFSFIYIWNMLAYFRTCFYYLPRWATSVAPLCFISCQERHCKARCRRTLMNKNAATYNGTSLLNGVHVSGIWMKFTWYHLYLFPIFMGTLGGRFGVSSENPWLSILRSGRMAYQAVQSDELECHSLTNLWGFQALQVVIAEIFLSVSEVHCTQVLADLYANESARATIVIAGFQTPFFAMPCLKMHFLWRCILTVKSGLSIGHGGNIWSWRTVQLCKLSRFSAGHSQSAMVGLGCRSWSQWLLISLPFKRRRAGEAAELADVTASQH